MNERTSSIQTLQLYSDWWKLFFKVVWISSMSRTPTTKLNCCHVFIQYRYLLYHHFTACNNLYSIIIRKTRIYFKSIYLRLFIVFFTVIHIPRFLSFSLKKNYGKIMEEKRLTSSSFPRSAISSPPRMNGGKFVNFTKNKRIRGWRMGEKEGSHLSY